LQESKIATFTFSIKPNWWERWWMRLLFVFAFGLMLYGTMKLGIRRSTQKLEVRQKELELIVMQRTAQIENDKYLIEQQADELKELVFRKYFS
jgi:uncharacterized protein HemX